MSVQRRKDSKGRVLKTGESERKDGTYMYRYSDAGGTRRSVYAPDLKALREKEEEINKFSFVGVDYARGQITVYELMQNFLEIKGSFSWSTKANYGRVLKCLGLYPISNMPIKYVKMSDAKCYILKIAETRKYSTVAVHKAALKSAFEMAREERIIPYNPFDFALSTLLKKEANIKNALTDYEIQEFFDFIRETSYQKYEDEFRILLGTGLRISELYGLTMNDIDFQHRRIHVNHQLSYRWADNKTTWVIHPPKSKAGNRFVPMSEEVYQCFLNVLHDRPHPEKEPEVDGYTDFVFLSKVKPYGLKCENFILRVLQRIEKNYSIMYPDKENLPHITPHVFRHTFCTNLLNNGANLKTVQYIMGHSNVDMTLSVYSHATEESVFKDFYNISSLQNTHNEYKYKVV